ncbi:UNVERIFIED_CONTAM: helix-turn-helix domain-containing protein [Kocuria sp. CPCC 205316]|uniref:helix-turn-helix domain-containing protein n=1 Tax=Kocuria TaxID=57493 RepID=UPI0036D82C8D
MADDPNTKKRKPFVPPPPGHDVVMTKEDVAKLLDITVQQVYEHNKNNKLIVHKIGRECRYLYSEVMTAFMNSDTRIKDDDSLHKKYTIEDLPKCWPPPERYEDGKPKQGKPRKKKPEEEPEKESEDEGV